ncbi:MAG: hypothetical protein ACODTL_20515 [Brucella sp.]|nr:hypothetical protein [Bacillus sp. PR5]
MIPNTVKIPEVHLTPEATFEAFSEFLSMPATAIIFALDYLEPWEVTDFLNDWRQGRGLASWLAAWKDRQKVANGDWSGLPADSGGN